MNNKIYLCVRGVFKNIYFSMKFSYFYYETVAAIEKEFHHTVVHMVGVLDVDASYSSSNVVTYVGVELSVLTASTLISVCF